MKQSKTHSAGSEIWEKVRQGSSEAFELLYEQHIRSLYNYGCKICDDNGLLEDSLQELFSSLWRKREAIIITHSIKHYLMLSLRRLLMRKLNRQRREFSQPDELSAYFNFEVELSVETQLINTQTKEELRAEVSNALQLLSKRQKEAIFLKYYENLDYEEIASIMDVNVASLYKLVSKGIKELRKNLKNG